MAVISSPSGEADAKNDGGELGSPATSGAERTVLEYIGLKNGPVRGPNSFSFLAAFEPGQGCVTPE